MKKILFFILVVFNFVNYSEGAQPNINKKYKILMLTFRDEEDANSFLSRIKFGGIKFFNKVSTNNLEDILVFDLIRPMDENEIRSYIDKLNIPIAEDFAGFDLV